MTQDRRSLRALSALLPTGILGLSISLASADSAAATSSGERTAPKEPESVALRLQAIRNSVSVVVHIGNPAGEEPASAEEGETQLAWWGNGGWRNGGWHNGGWGNGGWHNGGWGNGGWHNGGWGNGGWHNGWHNW